MNKIIKEPDWEKIILDKLEGSELKANYEKRLLKDHNGYWQTLAEIETANLFQNKFKIPVVGFNEKTQGDKNVDLVVENEGEKIYIEVTTTQYKKGKNSDLQLDSKLIKALDHASKKFLSTSMNLLILYDEREDSMFHNGEFMHENILGDYFNHKIFEYQDNKFIDMRRISALLLFGQRKYPNYIREHKLFSNHNAYLPLNEAFLSNFR